MCIRDSRSTAHHMDGSPFGKVFYILAAGCRPLPVVSVLSAHAVCGYAGAAAVSYTHLDVYKRQCNNLITISLFFLSSEPVGSSAKTTEQFFIIDVYKRQRLRWPHTAA